MEPSDRRVVSRRGPEVAEEAGEIAKRIDRLRRFILRNARDLGQLDAHRISGKLRSAYRVHLRRAIRLIVSLVPGVPIALLIRLVRPLLLVRIGTINTTRLGHLAMDVEMATAERELGINTRHPRTIDLWYPWGLGYPIANRQLLAMWKRSQRVLPAWILEGAAELNAFIPGGATHVIPYRRGRSAPSNFQDAHNALRQTPPHVTFLPDEERMATRELASMGIEPDDRLVAVHVRTNAFLARQLGAANSDHHDFRDADIANFRSAISWLVERGFTVLRMGTQDEDPFPGVEGMIDYAVSGRRSELLDVYIPSRVEFFFSVLSGPTHLAQLFRRPILLTNVIPMSTMMLSAPRSLFIPKRVETASGSPLALSDLIAEGLIEAGDSRAYSDRGLRVIENSAEEIFAVCEEMTARLAGTWIDTEHDESLHVEFLGLLPEYLKVGYAGGRLATTYLRRHEWIRS